MYFYIVDLWMDGSFVCVRVRVWILCEIFFWAYVLDGSVRVYVCRVYFRVAIRRYIWAYVYRGMRLYSSIRVRGGRRLRVRYVNFLFLFWFLRDYFFGYFIFNIFMFF